MSIKNDKCTNYFYTNDFPILFIGLILGLYSGQMLLFRFIASQPALRFDPCSHFLSFVTKRFVTQTPFCRSGRNPSFQGWPPARFYRTFSERIRPRAAFRCKNDEGFRQNSSFGLVLPKPYRSRDLIHSSGAASVIESSTLSAFRRRIYRRCSLSGADFCILVELFVFC